MQRKLNDEFIREYSEEFSEKASAPFFEFHDTISGKQILTFTASSQVNFFVLKSLFRKWQDEMKALESPFFDYKNQEVRKAMVQFMNVLSQHIQVKREAFERMLVEAVVETLMLASDPAGYLAMEFETLDAPNVNSKITSPLLKYIKIHKEDLQEFFEQNEGVSLDDFLVNTEELEDSIDANLVIEEQLELLSQVLPISEDDLFGIDDFDQDDFDDEEDDAEKEEEITEQSEEVEEALDELKEEGDQEPDSSSEEMEKSVEEEQEISDIEEKQGEADDEEELIEEDEEEEIILEEEQELEEEEAPADEQQETILEQEDEVTEEIGNEADQAEAEIDTEKFEEENIDEAEGDDLEEQAPTTINDAFSSENDTLADKLQNRKVESIMDAISVNHRYMFTKELFDGDREAFAEAIDQIDSCESFDDAVELLVQNFAKEREWDMNSDEVKELLKVIFRKYR
ncbi:MAG: hypothetical protein JXR10_03505 [Cyclobacteriaceae bacterium]